MSRREIPPALDRAVTSYVAHRARLISAEYTDIDIQRALRRHVTRDKSLQCGQKLVVLAALEFANVEDGRLYPSMLTLAVNTRLSERQARDSMRAAEAMGLFAVDIDNRESNQWVVRLESLTADDFAWDLEGEKEARRQAKKQAEKARIARRQIAASSDKPLINNDTDATDVATGVNPEANTPVNSMGSAADRICEPTKGGTNVPPRRNHRSAPSEPRLRPGGTTVPPPSEPGFRPPRNHRSAEQVIKQGSEQAIQQATEQQIEQGVAEADAAHAASQKTEEDMGVFRLRRAASEHTLSSNKLLAFLDGIRTEFSLDAKLIVQEALDLPDDQAEAVLEGHLTCDDGDVKAVIASLDRAAERCRSDPHWPF